MRDPAPNQFLMREVAARENGALTVPPLVKERAQLGTHAVRRPIQHLCHDVRGRDRAVAAVAGARANVRVTAQILERATALHANRIANLRCGYGFTAANRRKIIWTRTFKHRAQTVADAPPHTLQNG